MNQQFAQVFKDIQEIEPSFTLTAAIFKRIEEEEAKKLRFQLMISRLTAIGSGVLAGLALMTLGKEFMQSEFVSMLSLIFSDLTTVAQNWNYFGLSLLETFPTVTTIIILIPLLTLFMSMSSYIDLNNKQHKYI